MKSARENTPPRRALAEAQLGPHAVDRSPRRSAAISVPGEHFSAAIATDAPAIAGRRARAGFRIHRKMPLICPTCQIASSHAGGRLLLCMGLFSMFWERAPSQGSSPASSRSVRHSAEQSGFGEIAAALADDRARDTRHSGDARAKSQKALKFLELLVA